MSDNATDNADEPAVVLERTVAAPAAVVWSMWAESDHFSAWYGPTGAGISVADMDVRVGGRRHICMTMETPNGPMEMWFVGEYLEVTPTERLVYTESMSDADGTVKSPAEMGMPEGHPATTTIVVELEDLGDDTTRMIMTHRGVPADSPGAMGWGMALDKLEAHLAAA